MDQGQCLMWTKTKRKCSMSSNLITSTNSTYPSCYDDSSSWEEQAFAKDHAAGAAGCIWPPRSYSCGFCRREFRSAQALGGHMNVHRRDRARLKQQPSSPQNDDETLSHHHDLETPHHRPNNNHVQNYPFTSFGYHLYPSSLCGLAYNNTNPNYDPIASHVLASPNSKVLAASVNKTSPADFSKSKSNLAEDCRLLYSNDELEPESDGEKTSNSKGFDYSGCGSKGNSDKTDDVAVSLNLFVHHRANPSLQLETKEADISFKKRKTDASSIPLLFPKSSSVVDKHHVQSQVFEFRPSFVEELDLELRLGYRSKV